LEWYFWKVISEKDYNQWYDTNASHIRKFVDQYLYHFFTRQVYYK